jgi:hypothetical protein
MSNQVILRRLKKLEKVFTMDSESRWIDVLMWSGSQGGIFGHSHLRFSGNGRETERMPCSDEEEIVIMREHYEEDDRRLHGRGSKVSFAEYLECFSHLGAEELGARRRQAITRLKGGEDGVRGEDSSCRAC